MLVIDLYGGGVLMEPGNLQEWLGDEGVVQVGVDAAGAVLRKRFVAAGRVLMGPGDLLLWRLGRLKERLLEPLGK